MIAVGVGILVALVATVVFFVVYNSSRKGWQQSLAARESEVADLKVRNGVLDAQVKSCTARLAEVQAQLDFSNREREKLNREKGDLQARNQMLSENMEVQKQEVQRIRQEMNNEFKVLANEILQEKSKSFSEMNHERLAEILNPLKERLEGFKKTVEETYNNEARERFSLKEQIKELVERSESIGAEAKQLTHALRGDSKIQGDWGEMILESILEKSGLEKDREYFVQETLRDEEGHTIQGSDGRKMRPDVIIRYPGGESVSHGLCQLRQCGRCRRSSIGIEAAFGIGEETYRRAGREELSRLCRERRSCNDVYSQRGCLSGRYAGRSRFVAICL